jgi:hypothetical protein
MIGLLDIANQTVYYFGYPIVLESELQVSSTLGADDRINTAAKVIVPDRMWVRGCSSTKKKALCFLTTIQTTC